MSPVFRTNGNTRPMTDAYAAHEATGFATWRLAVGGLVARPVSLSLADVRARAARDQRGARRRLHDRAHGQLRRPSADPPMT